MTDSTTEVYVRPDTSATLAAEAIQPMHKRPYRVSEGQPKRGDGRVLADHAVFAEAPPNTPNAPHFMLTFDVLGLLARGVR